MRVAWIARRALSTAPAAAPSLTLYQYAVCPFCNKAQAFLEHYAIPHRRVEVNPLSKKEIAFSKDYRMVPLAVVHSPAGDRQVNGSDAIVDAVALAIGLPAPTIDEQRWRDFVNNRLVKLLPPNIYRTPSEALQAFDYISSASNFSAWEKFTAKYAGAVAMFFIARKSLAKYGIKDARAELCAAMDKWASEGVPASQPFHGGQSPDRADLAVYGVVRSLEGNYATWKDVSEKADPGFWAWYKRVAEARKVKV